MGRKWGEVRMRGGQTILVLLLIFLFTIFAYGSAQQTGSGLYQQGSDRIYKKDIEKFLLQNNFYVRVTEGVDAKKILDELMESGVISSYTQPFTSLGLPYYRLVFTTKPEQSKRLLALLLNQKKLQSIDAVPVFTIPPFKIQLDAGDKLIGEEFSQWYLEPIGFSKENLLCLQSNKEKVKIAVVDNGFDIHHPAIMGSVVKSKDIADADDDVSIVSDDDNWMHGTMNVGLIVGKKYNGNKGIWGTAAGNAEIYAIKATSDTAQSDDVTHGIEGVVEAMEWGADIIVISWGAYVDFPLFHAILRKAQKQGIQVIAAAGNYNKPDPFYPAAYDEVLGVGAFDEEGKRAIFSNYADNVQVYAPGSNLVVPTRFGAYKKIDGTSQAAPLYAGVYALLLHAFGRSEKIELAIHEQNNRIEQKPVLRISNEQVCIPKLPEIIEEPQHFAPITQSVDGTQQRVIEQRVIEQRVIVYKEQKPSHRIRYLRGVLACLVLITVVVAVKGLLENKQNKDTEV